MEREKERRQKERKKEDRKREIVVCESEREATFRLSNSERLPLFHSWILPSPFYERSKFCRFSHIHTCRVGFYSRWSLKVEPSSLHCTFSKEPLFMINSSLKELQLLLPMMKGEREHSGNCLLLFLSSAFLSLSSAFLSLPFAHLENVDRGFSSSLSSESSRLVITRRKRERESQKVET